MAQKVVVKKEKPIEEKLWQSCDKLRGTVEPSEYKHVVLGLIFLKFASDKFDQRRQDLIADGKEKYIEQKDFYNMKNVFFLEEISRWSFIIKNAKLGGGVAIAEIITKPILYYIHERIWDRQKIGNK